MRSPRAGLRVKLTLWFVLVFSLTQAVLVLGVVLYRGESIRRAEEAELEASAEAMVESLLSAEVAFTEANLARFLPANAGFVLVVLRDAEGTVQASWNLQDAVAVPFTRWETVPTGPQGSVTTRVGPELAASLRGEPRALRLITVPFRAEDQLWFLQAARIEDVVARWLGPFVDLLLIGVPIGTLAALLAAWVIAGRAVAPIVRLSAAARRVSPQRLGERFSVAAGDHEIARLEDELNLALRRLEEGYAAQDQFLSNVSHELKTPIAVLLTEAQVTRLSPEDGELRAFVEKAEREMQRLARLVESFLTLARSDLSRGRPGDRLDLNDIALEAVQGTRGFAEQHGVRLVPNLAEEDEPLVAGDADLLHTAVENLLRNAVQHSPEGEAVELVVRDLGAQLELDVLDRGPGIPEPFRETIFHRFARVPGRSKPGGSGLGLAIAQRVAHLHGGRIEARGREGGGASIAITLARRSDWPTPQDEEPAPRRRTGT